MDCEKHSRHLPELVDGQLSFPARWRLHRHLNRCGRCREELDALREVLGEVKQLPAPREDALFWENLHKRVMASLPAEPRRRPSHRYSVRLVPAFAAAAAALALVIALRGTGTPDRWVATDWGGEELVAVTPWNSLSDEELETVVEEIEDEQSWPSGAELAAASNGNGATPWEAMDLLGTDALVELMEALEEGMEPRRA
jgi:anti-sigma factor RsiW